MRKHPKWDHPFKSKILLDGNYWDFSSGMVPYWLGNNNISFCNNDQTFSWENYVVFLKLFLSHCQSSLFSCVPQERLLKLFTYREEEVEGRDRFVKIIPIMILLARERMWLLKMDLWKNSYPAQKNMVSWWVPNPLRITDSTQELWVLKANRSESHNPRAQVPLHFPSRLLSWNLLRRSWFGKALMWTSTCSLSEYRLLTGPLRNKR